jgi:hypothetical protein
MIGGAQEHSAAKTTYRSPTMKEKLAAARIGTRQEREIPQSLLSTFSSLHPV